MIPETLNQSQSILLTSHSHPDGDALGSLLAMGLALEKAGKSVVLYNESPIPAGYRFLPGVERITSELTDVAGFDCAVILDCGDLGRIGKQSALITRIPTVINIDHHPTNTGFGTHPLVDPDACATAEIVYRILRQMGIVLDAAIACGIYTGIFTDTGSLRFGNTTQTAFAICTEMVACGVDPAQVAKHVYGTYSLGRIRLLNQVLDSIEVSDNGHISIMTLTQAMFAETGAAASDVTGLVNYARHIEDVKIAALIQEAPPEEAEPDGPLYRVSLRSNCAFDVAAIATRYQGGGHAAAAGFSTTDTPETIKAMLFALSASFDAAAE